MFSLGEDKGYSKNEVKTPKFDNSIAYLGTIHLLMNKAHEFSLNRDLENLRITLSQLFIELEPRMNEDMINKAEELQNLINITFLNKNKKRSNYIQDPYILIMKFHRHLNICSHRLGLRMSDQKDKYDAAEM